MLHLRILNVGGPDHAADYRYTVHVNDREIASGEVVGHNRRKGWRNLVRMLTGEGGAELHARIAELERECAGYKQALQAADKAGCTVIVVSDDRETIRIFGPNQEREQAFAEQIARWFKLVNVVAEGLAVRHLRERVGQVREWAHALLPGNIEAQLVVDEIDHALEKNLECEPPEDLPDGWSAPDAAAAKEVGDG